MGLTGLGLLAFYQYTKEEKTKKVISSEIVSTGKPALGGPFVLVNQDGIPVTDASFRGQFLLLYFGFTFCPDICNERSLSSSFFFFSFFFFFFFFFSSSYSTSASCSSALVFFFLFFFYFFVFFFFFFFFLLLT